MYEPMIAIVAVKEAETLATNVHALLQKKRVADPTNAKFRIRDNVIPVHVTTFADNETKIRIEKTVRRNEVFLFFSPPEREPEKGIGRLQAVLNAIHYGSPSAIFVVMPNFSFGRQDRKDEARAAMTAKVMAKAVESQRTVRGLFTLDLHAEQLALAFDIPVDNLRMQTQLATHAKAVPGWNASTVGIVAPDVGSVKRAAKFAARSGFPLLGIIDKQRTGPNKVVVQHYIGDSPAGRDIILPDDLIDTSLTIIRAGEKMMELGAKSCHTYATHWVGSPKEVGDPPDPLLYTAEAKFRKAEIKVVSVNSIPRSPEYIQANSDILTFVPCEEMFANAIAKSFDPEESVSVLSE